MGREGTGADAPFWDHKDDPTEEKKRGKEEGQGGGKGEGVGYHSKDEMVSSPYRGE